MKNINIFIEKDSKEGELLLELKGDLQFIAGLIFPDGGTSEKSKDVLENIQDALDYIADLKLGLDKDGNSQYTAEVDDLIEQVTDSLESLEAMVETLDDSCTIGVFYPDDSIKEMDCYTHLGNILAGVYNTHFAPEMLKSIFELFKITINRTAFEFYVGNEFNTMMISSKYQVFVPITFTGRESEEKKIEALHNRLSGFDVDWTCIGKEYYLIIPEKTLAKVAKANCWVKVTTETKGSSEFINEYVWNTPEVIANYLRVNLAAANYVTVLNPVTNNILFSFDGKDETFDYYDSMFKKIDSIYPYLTEKTMKVEEADVVRI